MEWCGISDRGTRSQFSQKSYIHHCKACSFKKKKKKERASVTSKLNSPEMSGALEGNELLKIKGCLGLCVTRVREWDLVLIYKLEKNKLTQHCYCNWKWLGTNLIQLPWKFLIRLPMGKKNQDKTGSLLHLHSGQRNLGPPEPTKRISGPRGGAWGRERAPFPLSSPLLSRLWPPVLKKSIPGYRPLPSRPELETLPTHSCPGGRRQAGGPNLRCSSTFDR